MPSEVINRVSLNEEIAVSATALSTLVTATSGVDAVNCGRTGSLACASMEFAAVAYASIYTIFTLGPGTHTFSSSAIVKAPLSIIRPQSGTGGLTKSVLDCAGGTCLTIDQTQVYIKQVTFQNGGPAVEILPSGQLQVAGGEFLSNSGASGSAITVNTGAILELYSCQFLVRAEVGGWRRPVC